MRVLVTGDTHIPDWYGSLPGKLLDEAKKSDMILLTGDIVGNEVIETLNRYAPVKAVQGNFCRLDVKQRLPEKKVLNLDGWRIGLTHGHLGEGVNSDEMSLSLFKKDQVDVVVHGHTHHHHKTFLNDVLIIDPGSPLDIRFTRTNSYAIITLGDEINTEFVLLNGH
jgi:putative phosphoesterase